MDKIAMNETIFQVNLSLFSIDIVKQTVFQLENQFQTEFIEANKEYVKLKLVSNSILPHDMKQIFHKELVFVSVTQTTFEKTSIIRNALAQTALAVTDKEYNRYKETLKKLVKTKIKEKYKSETMAKNRKQDEKEFENNKIVSIEKISENSINIYFSESIQIPDILDALKNILGTYENPIIEIDKSDRGLFIHLYGENSSVFAEAMQEYFAITNVLGNGIQNTI